MSTCKNTWQSLSGVKKHMAGTDWSNREGNTNWEQKNFFRFISMAKGMCETFFCCFCSNSQSNHDAHHKLAKRSGADHSAANETARLPEVYGEKHHVIVTVNSQADDVDNKKPGMAKNDTFSEYITRTKAKIKASKSSVSMPKVASGEDYDRQKQKENDGKDVFSEFFSRAGIKIRKTSSVGSSRNISYQK